MSDSDESRIRRGGRNTQMVFAALARGKKNKKRTVVTIENENKEQKSHPSFRKIVSVVFQLIAPCCVIQNSVRKSIWHR